MVPAYKDVMNMNDIKHKATLVGDIFLTESQGQSHEDYQFVLNCIGLARHCADIQYNSESEPGRWIDYFTDILWKYGWNRDHPPIEHVRKKFSGSVRQVWTQLASPLLSRDQVDGVYHGLEALERDAELLSKVKGVNSRLFDFNIMPISCNANGDMELLITNIQFIKSNTKTRYIFWDISQDMTQLFVLARKAVISRKVMDARRLEVQKALAGVKFDFADIEL